MEDKNKKVMDQFKYEEALPYTINEYTNNYDLKRFAYIGGFVRLKDNVAVYFVENNNGTEKIVKNIIFY